MESTKQEPIFSKVIQERRSVRHYDPTFKISQQELKDILAEATLAPSSSNMQPWRFMLFDDPTLQQQLLPIASHQQQIVDASAVIAVMGDLEYIRNADPIYNSLVDIGYMTPEIKETLVSHLTQRLAARDPQYIKDILIFDCGLASMQLMLAAKAHGYDTVTMAGYDREQFVAAFDIPQRYYPLVLIAIGKASEPGHPSTRLPVDDVIFWNGFA